MLGLPLKLVLKVLQEGIVKIFTTQVGVTSGGFDGEHSTADIEERHIKSSSTQVEDEDILLRFCLSVETVSNSSGSGLVDDTEDFESSDGTGIFSGKTLRIVEIGGDAVG